MYFGSSSSLVCKVANTKPPFMQLPFSLLRRGLFVSYGKSKGGLGSGERGKERTGDDGKGKEMPFPLPIVPCALTSFFKILIEIPAGAFGANVSVIFFF